MSIAGAGGPSWRKSNMIGTPFNDESHVASVVPGIRAEVKLYSPTSCPVVGVSEATDAPSTSISKAVNGDSVTEEFVLQAEAPPDDEAADAFDGMEEVFTYGSQTAYRFERSRGDPCPCESIEVLGCPLLETYVRDGSLVVVFHANGVDHLREVLTDLRDRWSNVSVQRLIQSGDERTEQDLVFVDRSDLTDRQREVLETAHEMGYFEHPKGANATEVATELDIAQATLAEHLAAAQSKLLSSILDG